jgi:prepilin-type N-terminal cleavage/methylation domain-containing protein/prepilin-type processing-associated H-X9-DG protein
MSAFKNHTARGRRAGFTLIELLVVIAIIAVLMSLILPLSGMMQSKANQAKCTNNLRMWAIAIQGYAREHDGNVVWSGYTSISGTANYYQPYFGTANVTINGATRATEEYFRWCPSMKWSGTGNTPANYAFVQPSTNTGGTYTPVTTPTFNLRQAQTPANLLLMVEANKLNISLATDFATMIKPLCDGSGGQVIRHSGNINILFGDGHVSSYAWKDIDQDTPEEQNMVASWFHLN